jgi:Putative peptidoglycan binding domain
VYASDADMSGADGSTTAEVSDPPEPPPLDSPRRRRRLILAGVMMAILVVAIVTIDVADPFRDDGSVKGGPADNTYPTSLATVTQRSLSSRTEVGATLGYAGSYSVVVQYSGTGSSSSSGSETFTALPTVGQVVSQGEALYSVNGSPSVLLYGSTPAYRTLSVGMTGADVTELNGDLVGLGYLTNSPLSPTSGYFSAETAVALAKLQTRLGVTHDGTLTLGQAVFLPSSARITTVSATLGGPAQSGVTFLLATSTARAVTIDLDAAQQSAVEPGDQVTITLPNNQTTPGVVSTVATVATAPSSLDGSNGSSTPTVTVEVTPTDPAATGSLDQAPVEVSITTASAKSALVVPVVALLAVSGGGYAVEVVGAHSVHHLVPVSIGLFDDADGLVQVIASGLAVGRRVVVPAT